MDRGAWPAIVHRVTKTRTRLKQLSMYAPGGEGEKGMSGKAGEEMALEGGLHQ